MRREVARESDLLGRLFFPFGYFKVRVLLLSNDRFFKYLIKRMKLSIFDNQVIKNISIVVMDATSITIDSSEFD